MQDHFVFNDDELKRLLLNASRKGFKQIKSQYSDQAFYCFALYSHGSYSFAYTVASTEEGLTCIAERYLARNIVENWRWYDGLSLEQMRTMLRHSISDSPLHDGKLPETLFKEVCELAEERSTALFNHWCEIADDAGDQKALAAIQPYNQKFLDLCFDVLRQLDDEGLFGHGKQRSRVVVNFLTSNQSCEEMLTNASALNPPSVLEWYECELEAASGISRKARRAKQ